MLLGTFMTLLLAMKPNRSSFTTHNDGWKKAPKACLLKNVDFQSCTFNDHNKKNRSQPNKFELRKLNNFFLFFVFSEN